MSDFRGFRSPSRYFQGPGALDDLYEYTEDLGNNFMLILSPGGMKRYKDQLDRIEENAVKQVTKPTPGENAAGSTTTSVAAESSVTTDRPTFHREAFGGECTRAEIYRLVNECRRLKIDVIVGIGGGKVLDTAKATGHYTHLPVVVAPTSASSDAPCSAAAIIYHEDGTLEERKVLRRNPDTVIVDTAIIAKAPARLFAAGLGDALATYYEMHECESADTANFFGHKVTLAASAIACQCRDTVLAEGRLAYRAVRDGLLTRAVEDVTEANILLSGLGFESGGTCAAHPIHFGITALPASHAYMHGEKVAFALIAQLILSNYPEAEIREVMTFLHDVDLPITLAELGLPDASPDDIRTIAEVADGLPSTHRMAVPVDVPAIENAVLAADALGRDYLAKHSAL